MEHFVGFINKILQCGFVLWWPFDAGLSCIFPNSHDIYIRGGLGGSGGQTHYSGPVQLCKGSQAANNQKKEGLVRPPRK